MGSSFKWGTSVYDIKQFYQYYSCYGGWKPKRVEHSLALSGFYLALVGWGWVVSWCVTLSNSALEQARVKFFTVLEPGRMEDEDPTIKNPTFLSQAEQWLKLRFF